MTESTQDSAGERDAAGVLTPPGDLPTAPPGSPIGDRPGQSSGDAPAEASRRVGQYQIVRQIGRGGMAIVYLARQQPLDRGVALKELSSFQASAPGMAERFLREARLAGLLNHPNIVTVHEYFEESGVPYIAMEYAPRGSLRPYVNRISPAQFVGVMEGVLAGLAHAKEFGIVHRDLKPENIMVSSEGRVKIADFGIAKATASAATALLTATGMTVGTPSYMAPEQAMGEEVGVWTDLYSVGVMAWEHFVGRLPFTGTAPMVVLMKQVNEAIPPACVEDPELDPAISAWIDRLLVKDPQQRTRHPSTAWDELEEIVIDKLGPRWRREARLPSPSQIFDTPRPLTPAPFESEKPGRVEPVVLEPEAAEPATESGYVTFERPMREPTPEAVEVTEPMPTPEAVEVAESASVAGPAPAASPGPPPGRRRVPLKFALSVIAAAVAAAIAVVLVAGAGSTHSSSSTSTATSNLSSSSTASSTSTTSTSTTTTKPPPPVTAADSAPAGALAAVNAYWNDIRTGAFGSAYDLLGSGVVPQSQPVWIADREAEHYESVDFKGQLLPGATRGGSASVNVVSLRVETAQNGCQTFPGTYSLSYVGHTWLITNPGVSVDGCP